MSLAVAAEPDMVTSPGGLVPVARSLEPAPFSWRSPEAQYRLDYIALNELTREEEALAYEAVTQGLTPARQHRLDAIEAELDRRWALLG